MLETGCEQLVASSGFGAGGAHAAGALKRCGTPDRRDLRRRLPWTTQSCTVPGPQESVACGAQVNSRRRFGEERGWSVGGCGCWGPLRGSAWGAAAPLGTTQSRGSLMARRGGGWPPGHGAIALVGGPGLPAAWPGSRCLPQASESTRDTLGPHIGGLQPRGERKETVCGTIVVGLLVLLRGAVLGAQASEPGLHRAGGALAQTAPRVT
ncbi:hypothetical protein NDU88_001767 [Pleurodeles waltl]|uniref:Uncharacterized protein n=1 Tax=Pleurodeles waltl TaxID=8319 RepID=A0AAV7Q424_PLEWA|nr:hypothetical protein NDU88_001767 [Pleurodeles waltl]